MKFTDDTLQVLTNRYFTFRELVLFEMISSDVVHVYLVNETNICLNVV